MKLGRDVRILALIVLLDLLSTIVLVGWMGYREANPGLAYYLRHGLAVFTAVKLLTFIPALFILEWYRAANPLFVERVVRWGTVLYVGLYIAGLLAVHAPRSG